MKKPQDEQFARTTIPFVTVALVILVAASARVAYAEADGPDWWAVTGVSADDVLNMRAEASVSSRKIGAIPPDGQGLRNLGCTGAMSYAEWEKATEAERERAKGNKWCKIEYRGTTGWVAGRYLMEGGPPQDERTDSQSGEYSFGAWKVFCEPGSCVSAYQYGRGGSVPTILRFKRGDGSAPEIFIEGGPFVPTGDVIFTIDGKLVSSGRASIIQAVDGDDLYLPSDDITIGLARQMEKGGTLQLTVPRERGAETIDFDLDGFAEALQRVNSPTR